MPVRRVVVSARVPMRSADGQSARARKKETGMKLIDLD
jgi:hypothetical protein